MKKTLLMVTLAAASLLCACTSYDVTLSSLLDEMTDRDALTRYPTVAYKAAQVSSYDRRTVAPDAPGWWANADGGGYERMDTIAGRLEKVLCDLEGAGALTRFWMTTKDKNGTMRIYLDGAEDAQIVIPAYDMKKFPIDVPAGLSLTHTHYEEVMEGVGGNSFFLPIPFAKGCKVTLEEPDDVWRPRYYHIGYRLYPEGTSVKTFTLREAKALSRKIAAASADLLEPADAQAACVIPVQGVVEPGDALDLSFEGKDRKITRLVISTPDPESFVIEACFDGVKTVAAPLAHFAGAGIGAPDVNCWWLTNMDGEIAVRFPMPFRQGFEISLVNVGESPAEASVEASVADYVWDENSLYFHASHRAEKEIPVSPDYDSDDNLDWNFMTIDGRGVYVGDLLSLDNHAIDWYGEGDEKIFVDDDVFPSFMGTGTEDYFNCSWAPVVPFLTPYGGAPRADEESSHGLNAFLRTRNLDIIPFASKMRFDIEMLSWHPGTVDYYATSFWYGDIDTVANSTL